MSTHLLHKFTAPIDDSSLFLKLPLLDAGEGGDDPGGVQDRHRTRRLLLNIALVNFIQKIKIPKSFMRQYFLAFTKAH